MKKILTIAIPTYNRKDYLKLALNSILSQYDDRVELIVSDNCSTDGTDLLIKENYPQVTYYKNESNLGMINFSKCYERASGKYMMLFGDDDIFIEDSLKYIIQFLEQNDDMSVVFLNHRFFVDKYLDKSHCQPAFFDEKNGDFITSDKKKFMNYARHQITFISCFILLKSAYLKNCPYDKYYDNHFFQTCVAFECMREKKSKMGIISKTCIAQNMPSNTHNQVNMSVLMNVFGKEEHFVFCNLGPRLDQNKRQMNKIYSSFICKTWPRFIVHYKINGLDYFPFWKIGFPICMKFWKAWIFIIPFALLPKQIIKLLIQIKKAFRRKNR